jgi:catechol 2,3-dioxygenase-like lactoylglutathione lyase family enzyme
MTTFTVTIPVLPALNMKETLAFYEHHLGFKQRHIEKEFGIITKDDLEIHFWLCDERKICESSGCRILVKGIDELYGSLEQSIIHPNAKLESKPWGAKEFGMLDNSGNLITFAEYGS